MTPWVVPTALSLLERVADSLGNDPAERRRIRQRLWEDEALVTWIMDQFIEAIGGWEKYRADHRRAVEWCTKNVDCMQRDGHPNGCTELR